MATRARRFVLFICALSATLVLGGAGAGIAGAEPDDPGSSSDTEFSFNLSDPESTFATVQDTLATLDRLASDAHPPYNPFPPPRSKPTMETTEEEPVIDSSGIGGVGGGPHPMPDGMAELPVLQAPMALPGGRPGSPRPLAEIAPVGAPSQVLGVGTAGIPAGRGSVTKGSVRAGEATPADTTSPMGNTAYRQGFPQYLRAARTADIATVALPGVAGLLAITASGGVIGYRQANSGRNLRADATRFAR